VCNLPPILLLILTRIGDQFSPESVPIDKESFGSYDGVLIRVLPEV
jgi:hypothetical protein